MSCWCCLFIWLLTIHLFMSRRDSHWFAATRVQLLSVFDQMLRLFIGTVREWNGSIWLTAFMLSGSVNSYGKVFKSHILGTLIIVSTDSELNKVILQDHGNAFVPAYPKSIRELLGENSILQMNGSLQKRIHALIGGFLRSPQLKSRIVRDIESSVKLALASWGEKGGSILFQEEIKKVFLARSPFLSMCQCFLMIDYRNSDLNTDWLLSAMLDNIRGLG